jgi:CheY-like chemotaxis protein
MTPAEKVLPTCTIASDSPVEASLVKSLLEDEFENILIRLSETGVATESPKDGPCIFVLAFRELEKAEQYYLSVQRGERALASRSHRAILLCKQEDRGGAYDLCRRGLFDDYVVFWPMTHDPKRLPMAVHRALAELQCRTMEHPTVAAFAAQVRGIAELESMLSAQLRQGQEHIAGTGDALSQAARSITLALDDLRQRLGRSAPQGEAASDRQARVGAEFARSLDEHIHPQLRSLADCVSPLQQWASKVMADVAPQLESARALGELAARVRPNVLVVDDDEFQRSLLGRTLVSEGYEPIYAATGAEALNTLRRITPDVILLDFQMPDLDGVQVVKRLKAEPRLANVPVIMITAVSNKNVVLESHSAGASDYIVKPFNRQALTSKLARALGKTR